MIYDHETNDMTFDDRERPKAVFPATDLREADRAMAYAENIFKRLTGCPTRHVHDHAHRRAYGNERGNHGAKEDGVGSAEADRPMAYAENTFARMRGYRPDHPHNRDRHLEYGHGCDDRVAREGWMAGAEADRAMAFAKDMFRRLRGLPAQGPLGLNGRQDEARQRRCQRPSRSGGRLRNSISTARTVSSSVNGSLPIANAIRRAMVCLAMLIRAAVLEPYAQRRRRRIAIAQLKALDDRLLADIGLSRNDIERVVDGMLACRGDTSPRPATRSLPAEDHQHDLPLAA